MTIAPRYRTRTLAGVSALAATALLTAACSSSSDSGSGSGGATSAGGAAASSLPKTLIFSPLSLQPPALKGLSDGIKGYAGSKGWEVLVQDPNFDATKQGQDLSAVLDSGRAGAVWVLAIAPKSFGDTIKAAQGKGIPILVNGKPDEYGYSGPQAGVTFDYIDYTAGGKALGDQLGKCITQKLGGTAEVAFAQSTAGQAGKDEFEAAAIAGLKAAAPNATIVQSIIVKDRASGQTDFGNALQGHPNLAAVMSSTDEGALGAIGAFNAAGKTAACVTDFGGDDEVLKDVKAGSIFASVALQFNDDMTQSFDTLAKMQSDPTAKGQVLTVPQKIVTAGG